MLYPLSWLKDYLSLDDLNDSGWTGEKIGQQIALTFCEYEGREEIFFDFRGIVVGKVLEVYSHPNADKLSLAQVDVGKKKLRIVCGAPNLQRGMMVPVATTGTKLKNGMQIEEVEVRGERSEGMICAASELGLEDESAGIMDLGKNLRVGSALDEVIDFADEVLEFTIPFNRPDAMSIRGMAKEVSAACDVRFYEPRFKVKEQSKEKIDDLLDAQVKDMAGCLRYSARVVDGVKVGESPMWLKRRLVMAGMRPINSVVDITNYVMLEYGQPMHAFDYDSIIGHKLVIRRAKKGERIMTLDDQKKVLSARDLIIADEKRPLALAGIIGGADSGVLPNTRRIVLESANFARKLINESSRTLGVQTDSSIRFGKGLPMALTTQALDRAAYLISQICGGQVAQGMIDVRSQRLLKKDQKLRYENIDSFLGIDVPKNDVKKILKSLDFEIKKPGDDDLTVGISPLRVDIENEDDLIEEVGRIYGYNKIEPEVFEMPVVVPGPEGVRRYRNRILNYLCDRGYSEVYSYCFVSTKDLSGWGFDVEDSYELLNPVDKNLQFLRQSLISGMVEKYKKWKKYDEQVKLFEWGQVFGKKLKNKEKTHLSMIFSDKEDGKDLFLQVKGVIEGMLRLGNVGWNDFDLKRAKEVDCDIDILHPVNSVVLIKDKGIIGSFGLIHPMKLSESKIPGKVVFAEFDLEKLVNSFVETVEYKEPSKFPVSKYDISLFVDNNVMSGEMIVVAKDVGGKTLKDVVVFDEISGEKLLITKDKLLEGREAEDLKSVGLRFGWQSDSETLSDERVEKNMQKVIGKLKEEFGVVLRDG